MMLGIQIIAVTTTCVVVIVVVGVIVKGRECIWGIGLLLGDSGVVVHIGIRH